MEKFRCNICDKKFNSEDSLNQHNSMKHTIKENRVKIKKKHILISLLVIALFIFIYTFYVRANTPGVYDDFAKCLGEKTVVYGNDYCSYTNQQLNMFGKSKKYLNYVKCIDNEGLCNSKNVEITPTWEINGEIYSGVQSFEKLSQVSGCGI